MGRELQRILDEKTNPWGITVQSVEIRDVKIPQGLEDAMSRQAQAERERQARIILGQAEKEIADSFVQAAASYAENPVALHLRAMNMLYEAIKETRLDGHRALVRGRNHGPRRQPRHRRPRRGQTVNAFIHHPREEPGLRSGR